MCRRKSSLSTDDAEVASLQQPPIRVMTWERLQSAVVTSPLCKQMSKLLQSGPLEDKEAWPALLQPYHSCRSH